MWLRGFGQRSGCAGPFIVDGADMAAVGVSTFRVVADQPPEDLAAAGGSIFPAVIVLEDFAFEGRVERFGERVVSTRSDRAHRLGDPELRAEFREIL